MRSILNISLPQQTISYIDAVILNDGYSTRSEFIRSLIRDYKDKKLALELKKSHKEIKNTGGYKLKSLKELR